MKKTMKIMKRAIALTMLLGMTVFLLSGCKAEKVIDTGALADDLYSGVTWKDQLDEIDLNRALTVYGISTDSVASGKVYMGTNATAEEIAVLEATDSAQVADIKAGVEARVEAQLNSFQSYNAAEVPKLENPVIQTRGNYVILCICDNNSEAEEIINNCFTK